MKTKGKIQDIYPLTPMQEGMLFHALYEKGSSTYFVQTSYRLHGELNVSYIKKSLNDLLRRYDILRTVFIYEGRERPLQVVLKEREIDFYFEDIRKIVGKNIQKINAFIEQFRKKDRQRSFDLSKDVLIRVLILQVGDSEYEFIWSNHHILMDGWCTGILVSEFLEIYNSYLEDRPHRLPKAKQFKTYIEWLEKQDKDEAKNYWKKYLENYQEPAVIPFKELFNKGMVVGYEPGQNSLKLDAEKTYALKELAARNQVTLNTLIQVVWGIILGKYNDRNDVVYGAVVSGRPSQLESIESVIGIFINTIPVRIGLGEKTKITELLQRAQKEAINSEPYHHYPLVEIQTESPLKRNLFDHIIVFENYPVDGQLGGHSIDNEQREKLELSNVESFVQTSYDFNLTILPAGDITIIFDYNANVYESDFIKKVANHFDHILTQILNDPQQEHGEITILSVEEKKRLLNDFNNTGAEYPEKKTIHELFEEQVERAPDNIAVVGIAHELLEIQSSERTGGLAPLSVFTSITYKELNEKSNHLAYVLKEKGLSPDTIVGIMLERSIEMIIGILGILKSGGGYLPIDPIYPGERIRYMLKDSRTPLLLTQSKYASTGMGDFEGGVLNLEGETLYNEGKRSPNPIPVNGPQALVYVIYTSGSTGHPKGAMIKTDGFVNLLSWYTREFSFASHDRVLLIAPISFDLSQKNLFAPLITGASLCLPVPGFPDYSELSGFINRKKITVVNCAPSMFYPLVELNVPDGFDKLRSLRKIFLGGESIQVEKLLPWFESETCGAELINTYGPTECTDVVSFYRVKNEEIHQRENIPIGVPISNSKLYVLDKSRNPMPVGLVGELFIGGICVSCGYLNNPQLTAEKFTYVAVLPKEKIYRTGDLVKRLPCGNIEFLGRIDFQVKIRGFRVELGEIEKQLLRYEEIKAALVLTRKNENGEAYLCAYIVAQREFLAVELREYLAKELPDYMIPSYFVQVEKIPLTLNGKVDKKILESYSLSMDSGIEYIAPENHTEELIASTWKEVLSIDDVGVNDNFFDVGGHSLNIIRVNSKLKSIFQKDIPIVEMFRYSTVRSLARYLDNGKSGDISNEKIDRSLSVMEKTTKLFLGN